MGSRGMSKLEIEDPKSACHGQTGGWPNGELGECGRGKYGCGCLSGWRVGSRVKEGMVRVATLTSLEKRSNLEYISIGPETIKTGRRTRSRNSAPSGRRLVR